MEKSLVKWVPDPLISWFLQEWILIGGTESANTILTEVMEPFYMNTDNSQPQIAPKIEAQVVYQNQLGFVMIDFVIINVNPYKYRWYI